MFYVPKCKGFKKLRNLIEDYGGIVINIVECCCVQVCPDNHEEDTIQNFRKGYVMKESWIHESIASKRRLHYKDYVKMEVKDELK